MMVILQKKFHRLLLKTRNVVIITASEELSPQVMMIGMRASDQPPMASGSNKPSNAI